MQNDGNNENSILQFFKKIKTQKTVTDKLGLYSGVLIQG